VKSTDPRLAVNGAATVRELIDRDVTQERLVTKLTGAFAGLALLLAAIGLYGVISYAVARRTGEIGIRMALGAQRDEVLWMALREVLLLTLIGVGLGLPAVFAGTRVISSLLFGLTPADPTTIAISMFLMFSVAALAGYVPARRAARTDPMEALRYE
jgi:ABC-type antimicrobial peptide transport system permease subunit